MILRPFAQLALLSLFALSATAQSTPAPPAFVAADVHASPHHAQPFFYTPPIVQSRYVVHDATMVDLIQTAYGLLDRDNVHGGPSWLEQDHFDIIAKIPPNTSQATLKLMLRTLLTERFQLVVHTGSAPVPAFVMIVAKGGPKLKEAASASDSGCGPKSGAPNGPGANYIEVSCHNLTMDAFAEQIHNMAGGYLTKPVVNSTALEGAWDFDIKWTGRGQLEKQGPDGISIFDAAEKQLGLKLELQTAPRPVILVDSVLEKPTPNPPGLEKILPPQPPAVFEVATIRPSKPGSEINGGIHGGQIDLRGASLKFMMTFAWELNQSDPDAIANAPKWLDQDHYDILAKVSSESVGTVNGIGPPIDIEDLRQMLRALLIERFQMKLRTEDRPANAFVLLAPNPKLKPADPASRTVCKEAPGPDGKDPRIATPILNRLLYCQNVSMAQIADELHLFASYVPYPVVDESGLKGAYDFTLSFTSIERLNAGSGAPGDSGVSDPNGALSMFDALNRQLGLKLEKQKRPLPTLVIDHIEEKPIDN